MTTFTKASHGLSAPTAVTAGAGTTYSPTVGILTVTYLDRYSEQSWILKW